MEKIGLYPFTVQPYQVDFQQRITLTGLGYYLLESAGIHADQRTFGLRDLLKMGKAWFLTRLSVRMERYPMQYEKIWIETWVDEVGDVFTSRNFQVLDERKEVIGGASTSWAMIDLKTRRPESPIAQLGESHVLAGRQSMVKRTEKVSPMNADHMETKPYQVVYSDLDILRHVNSIRYIQWIVDLFPLDLFEERQVRQLDINYMAETNFGDEMEFRLAAREDRKDYHVEISKKETQSPVCRGRVRWGG